MGFRSLGVSLVADTILTNLYHCMILLCFDMGCSGFADRAVIRREEPYSTSQKMVFRTSKHHFSLFPFLFFRFSITPSFDRVLLFLSVSEVCVCDACCSLV